MTESHPESAATETGTGIETVDAVVAGLDALDDLPVADHVAVFEHAHEALRAQMASSSGGLSGGSSGGPSPQG
ncbi:MAG: hypothetical protein JOZ82_04935 [Marmoricola sp.]|nr:hypothetical protein [Marmoricola sp.]